MSKHFESCDDFDFLHPWMVRVWFNARDDEDFIDEMPSREFLFATKSDALAFKRAFNEKFSNHGGWEPYIVGGHRYGSTYVAGSPAEGPYERVVETEVSVEEALTRAFNEADDWGMEDEDS